jgi:endonuclease III
MKNATKHGEELKALCKRLVKEHKPAAKAAQEPLKALVRAHFAWDASDARADEAMAAIAKEFVDLNELRVATELEVQELIGQKYPEIEKRVAAVTLQLNFIFEKEHTLSLDRLKTLGKKDARQFLRDLPEQTPFVEAYTMLYAFDAPMMPVDDEIRAYLLDEGVLEEGTNLEDAQKFVENQLKVEEIHEFFVVVRKAAAEGAKGKKKVGK